MQKKICFIGGGNMCSCLLLGLQNKNFPMNNIFVVDRNLKKRKYLEKTMHVTCFAEEDLNIAISKSDVIFLTVKPKDIQKVCQQISSNNVLIISIAAGISCNNIKNNLANELNIIRAMPNIGAEVLASATGLFTTNCTDWQRKLTNEIFGSVGTTIWIEQESYIDIVTALSGSGPAYFFLFTNMMIEAATELGIPQNVAIKLATQTLAGAGQLTQNNDLNTLISKVTSKGGTTEIGLQTLKTGGIKKLVKNTITAAYKRAVELNS